MKFRFFTPLLALLLLVGCSEDDEPTVAPTPAPQNLCYLQEQTNNSTGASTRYTYNEFNQIIRTEHYEQENLAEVRTYTYTAAGKLAEERLLAPDGEEEISFTVYSYNPQGRVSKYEVKQRVPGLQTVHRLSSFKAVYDTRGRLTSATDYLYLNNTEVSNGSVTQTYPQSKPVVATVKSADGQTYTATYAQDSARYAPLFAVPVFLQRRPGVAYPHLSNITVFNATTGSGEEQAQVNDVAYTAEYTYNDQGYPITATYTYTGGRTESISYEYNCTE
ncbi:hypothetical protein [Pontibacter anaerobius]|uniref:YD repeat-containing protein n=1 Tax=Pontibacter anaerobius TaxID=2993940 RepID=A0ABT3RIP0_9BACT|nr:hypothetical protein [Pontibacter anaerobius]MCX2741529.1 hypothetical protein [Pontibacter anaerobius]